VRYWLLAAVSSLSAFAIFAVAGSLIARAAVEPLARMAARTSAAGRARALFRLRMLPGALAAVAAFAIALPIFLRFEARDTTESIGLTLGVLACAGAWLLVRGAWQAAAALVATRRVVADWQRRARPVTGLHATLPVYAVDETFPLVAVTGLLRPRLFVAERVLRECPVPEVAAMIAHECAHVSARDNGKLLLMRACPALFGAAARLEHAWSAAAEEAADAAVVLAAPSARLDLAQALIRVARLAAARGPELASAFYTGDGIAARVRLLVDPPADVPAARWPRFLVPAAAVLAAAGISSAAPSLHAAMEIAVRLLP
jgi:Zn-dependent protease with chaperone function